MPTTWCHEPNAKPNLFRSRILTCSVLLTGQQVEELDSMGCLQKGLAKKKLPQNERARRYCEWSHRLLKSTNSNLKKCRFERDRPRTTSLITLPWATAWHADLSLAPANCACLHSFTKIKSFRRSCGQLAQGDA